MSNIPSQYLALPGYKNIYDDGELRQAIAYAEVLSLANGGTGVVNSSVPKSAVIATDGTTGDKTIITSSNTGKQIYISSLYFMANSQALVTLKSGGTNISGQMNIISFPADFVKPLILGINQNFVINLGTAIAINGIAIYWEA